MLCSLEPLQSFYPIRFVVWIHEDYLEILVKIVTCTKAMAIKKYPFMWFLEPLKSFYVIKFVVSILEDHVVI